MKTVCAFQKATFVVNDSLLGIDMVSTHTYMYMYMYTNSHTPRGTHTCTHIVFDCVAMCISCVLVSVSLCVMCVSVCPFCTVHACISSDYSIGNGLFSFTFPSKILGCHTTLYYSAVKAWEMND